jgi:hypothetical protein
MIESRNVILAGNVARMGFRNAYNIFIRKPKGKRPLRRPRHRWEENIKLDLRKRACGVD